MKAPNSLRGEVAFTVGGVKAFAALKMDPLKRWSDSLNNPPLGEILRRINTFEVGAIVSFVEHMTIDTDVDAVKEKMAEHFSHCQEVIGAANELLKPFLAETSSKKE